jgi:hypothetical protein
MARLDNPVGAAEGCDLLILFLKIKVKRSQPSAAPTGESRSAHDLLILFLKIKVKRSQSSAAPTGETGSAHDLLILFFKIKVKRSQPSAAPTGSVFRRRTCGSGLAREEARTAD